LQRAWIKKKKLGQQSRKILEGPPYGSVSAGIRRGYRGVESSGGAEGNKNQDVQEKAWRVETVVTAPLKGKWTGSRGFENGLRIKSRQ